MKKVNFKLIGKDGNAFMLLGGFRKQARKDGWTIEQIKAVIADATSRDYDHLLQVLIAHCA